MSNKLLSVVMLVLVITPICLAQSRDDRTTTSVGRTTTTFARTPPEVSLTTSSSIPRRSTTTSPRRTTSSIPARILTTYTSTSLQRLVTTTTLPKLTEVDFKTNNWISAPKTTTSIVKKTTTTSLVKKTTTTTNILKPVISTTIPKRAFETVKKQIREHYMRLDADVEDVNEEDYGGSKVYKVKKTKTAWLFGFIPLDMRTESIVDGQMREIEEQTPWWSIFTTDVGAKEFKDDDGDGIQNIIDSCKNTPFGVVVGANGCWCHDSDGGKEYAVKGSLSHIQQTQNTGISQELITFADNDHPFQDQCINGKILKENFCENEQNSFIEHKCDDACYNGECKNLKITNAKLKPDGLYSAIITWKTSFPTFSKVYYRALTQQAPDINYNQVKTISHEAKLSALSPSTDYEYRIEACTDDGKVCEYTEFMPFTTCGCLIGGECVPEAGFNEDNNCQICDSQVSKSSWSRCYHTGNLDFTHTGGKVSHWKFPMDMFPPGCYLEGDGPTDFELSDDYFIGMTGGEQGIESYNNLCLSFDCKNGTWEADFILCLPQVPEVSL